MGAVLDKASFALLSSVHFIIVAFATAILADGIKTHSEASRDGQSAVQ